MRITNAAVFMIVALAAASAGGATTDSLTVEWLEIDQEQKTLRIHPTFVARD